MKAVLIFPHQMFHDSILLSLESPIFIVEDARYFSDFAFHKHKLILHRASMKAYAAQLEKKGHKVHYVDHADSSSLFELLHKKKISELHYFDITDNVLEKRLEKLAKKYSMTLKEYETPYFLTSREWIHTYFAKKEHFALTPFYIEQRKRLKVLITKDEQPLGGKWSFDPENRKKMPTDMAIPSLIKPPITSFVKEAFEYIEKHFKKNPGTYATFWFPTTHQKSVLWLNDFLEKRFQHFGDYEDAIVADQEVLFHSVFSPLLNCGLLTPALVLEKTLLSIKKNNISINNAEGFIRQLIGWREFIRATYILVGEKQRTSNFWQHTKKLPSSFWQANTGIIPVDTVIERVMKYAYAHHIERLMILGNFMLLNECNPDDVYAWFMELFIDSYDWVMVPNVYCMSQYADGGLMTTKPYISSSNYILKMSDFSKGPWCEIWDALYWRFIHTHKKFFAKNPRLAVMTYHLTKMKKTDLEKKLTLAEHYLKNS